MKTPEKEKKPNAYGLRHWTVIVFGFVLFYFCNACMTDGMNVIVPRLAEERGWDYTHILSFASLAGCVSVFGQLGFGLLFRVLSPRKTISLALLGASGFFALYASGPARQRRLGRLQRHSGSTASTRIISLPIRWIRCQGMR